MNSDGPTLLLRPQSTRHTMHDMHEDFHNLYVKSQFNISRLHAPSGDEDSVTFPWGIMSIKVGRKRVSQRSSSTLVDDVGVPQRFPDLSRMECLRFRSRNLWHGFRDAGAATNHGSLGFCQCCTAQSSSSLGSIRSHHCVSCQCGCRCIYGLAGVDHSAGLSRPDRFNMFKCRRWSEVGMLHIYTLNILKLSERCQRWVQIRLESLVDCADFV